MSTIRSGSSETGGLQFKPIYRDENEKVRRSQIGRSRGLPPSRSSSSSSSVRLSHRNQHKISEAFGSYGGRRYSGSRDDSNKTSNDFLSDRNDVQERHKSRSYNNRLLAARSSEDDSSELLGRVHPSFLNRRSSSVMRVRELRDVLNSMTSSQGEDEEQEMKGSQKARLLVASQQRLMSRLQDLSHQLESIDNEVTRVKGDIISSRKYFSAMTGIPYGPDWHMTRQMDSAYTSPTSCLSPDSSEESPPPSDTEWLPASEKGMKPSPTQNVYKHGENYRLNKREHVGSYEDNVSGYRHQSRQSRNLHKTSPSASTTPKLTPTINVNDRPIEHFSLSAENKRRHGNHTNYDHVHQKIVGSDEQQTGEDSLQSQFDRLAYLESPFKSLADFNELGSSESGRESAGLMSGGPLLTRSDSCSSFMSWRSDQEMASLFPDEADTS